MGCTHVPDCPLFPKLNASLRGWRDAYCDSDTGWQSCARYQQSHTGRAVPLTLLPNGRYAHTITRVEGAGDERARSRFGTAPTPVLAGDATSPFERAATRPAAAAQQPDPAQRAEPRAAATALRTPAPSAPAAAAPRPSRWTRLLNWMRGPA